MEIPNKYAVLGWPVHHSLSPVMHQAAFAATGLNATYERLAVEPERLSVQIQELKAQNYQGWNVTLPHKGAIAALVDVIDPLAKLADSINTVKNVGGTLHGYSTDGYGLEMAISDAFDLPVTGRRFLFWGTGGATRAVAVHFAERRAAWIGLVNRTVAKAVALQRLLMAAFPDCKTKVITPNDWRQLLGHLKRSDVVIQATSIGLQPEDPASMPLELLTSGMNVMDMIYRPTLLLRAATERGCRTADGLGMLLHQGARSFTLWTGRPAPVAAMRAALTKAMETTR